MKHSRKENHISLFVRELRCNIEAGFLLFNSFPSLDLIVVVVNTDKKLSDKNVLFYEFHWSFERKYF